jgi:hypothetical protein
MRFEMPILLEARAGCAAHVPGYFLRKTTRGQFLFVSLLSFVERRSDPLSAARVAGEDG